MITTLDKLREIDTARYNIDELAGLTTKHVSSVGKALRLSGLPYIKRKTPRQDHISFCQHCGDKIIGGPNRKWCMKKECQRAKKEHWGKYPPRVGKPGKSYNTWDSNWSYCKKGKCNTCDVSQPVNYWGYCPPCWDRETQRTGASQEWEEAGL